MSQETMEVHDPAAPGVGLGVHPGYPSWPNVVTPLPNISLMDTIGAGSLENFFIVGEGWASLVGRYLPHGGSVLDAGCGCGRTARLLLLRPDIRYVGFDIFKPAIDWANQHVVPLSAGRFRFSHFDGYSAHYNPSGKLKAAEIRFPAGDASQDVAFAASLFTHLLEEDANHYLRESARVLKRGGVLIASIHDEPRAGEKFSGREDRIDVDRAHFGSMAAAAGFALREDIGSFLGQETLVFERK